ncbi:MAG: hypothetical protein KF729_12130 [Sandaracinaceae bacterium]|nr:hypothetical protein [Sandaracinaceae bacterium]
MACAGQPVSLDAPVAIRASEIVATYILPPLVATRRPRPPGIELDVRVAPAALRL